LKKLQHNEWKRSHRYSLWQHDSNLFSVTSESTFMQKVNYIHQNPVRAGLVERAEDYKWSSARYWKKCPREDEPLKVDIEKDCLAAVEDRLNMSVAQSASRRLAAHQHGRAIWQRIRSYIYVPGVRDSPYVGMAEPLDN